MQPTMKAIANDKTVAHRREKRNQIDREKDCVFYVKCEKHCTCISI